MKVAINRCFGGFSISNEAFENLLERKGIVYHKLENDENKSYLIGASYYHAGHAGEEEFYLSEYEFIKDRSDRDLIAVLEEMGEKAWGWAAEISIVEIPDDVEWHISEYDGLEHVAENHRTWS